MTLEVRRAYPAEETVNDFARMDAYPFYEIGVPPGSSICIESVDGSLAVPTYQTDPWEHGKKTIRIPKPLRKELNVEVGDEVRVTRNVRQFTPSLE